MCNLTTTMKQYTMQQTLLLEDWEETSVSMRNLPPTFKPYDNKQVQMILDLEMYIPAHHVARGKGKPPGTLEYDLGRVKSKGQKSP